MTLFTVWIKQNVIRVIKTIFKKNIYIDTFIVIAVIPPFFFYLSSVYRARVICMCDVRRLHYRQIIHTLFYSLDCMILFKLIFPLKLRLP